MTTRAKTKTEQTDDSDVVEAPAGDETTPDADVAAADERRAARATALQRRKLQYGEYGQWVAKYDLHDDGGALAFATGHPIPVDRVDEETGAVILARHRCHHTPDVRCEQFNAPELWSEDGAAVRPDGWVDPADPADTEGK
jgi:hypothetical protein